MTTICGYMGPGGHGCYLPADHNHDHRFPLCRATGGGRHFCTHLKGHSGDCNYPKAPAR